MMEDFDVNIAVPPPENKDDIIVVTGPAAQVADALKALSARNDDIEKENEDRRLRQYELVMNVPAEYHPKLIGESKLIFVLDCYNAKFYAVGRSLRELEHSDDGSRLI